MAAKSGRAQRTPSGGNCRCCCLISISESAPSLKTMVMQGAPASAAVASSATHIINPPSPVKAMAPSAGFSNAAASAAGSAKPIEARPLEISTSRGAAHSQKAVAENICAPASTLMRGLRPARRAASCARLTIRGGATPPVPCQVSAARIVSRCVAISSAFQALRAALCVSAVKHGASAPCSDAVGVT